MWAALDQMQLVLSNPHPYPKVECQVWLIHCCCLAKQLHVWRERDTYLNYFVFASNSTCLYLLYWIFFVTVEDNEKKEFNEYFITLCHLIGQHSAQNGKVSDILFENLLSVIQATVFHIF